MKDLRKRLEEYHVVIAGPSAAARIRHMESKGHHGRKSASSNGNGYHALGASEDQHYFLMSWEHVQKAMQYALSSPGEKMAMPSLLDVLDGTSRHKVSRDIAEKIVTYLKIPSELVRSA